MLPPRGGLLKRSLDKPALPNVWFDPAALCLNSKPETFPCPTPRGYVKDAVDIAGADKEKILHGNAVQRFFPQ